MLFFKSDANFSNYVRWFSPGIPVSSTNKTGHDMTEILLKVALNTKTKPNYILLLMITPVPYKAILSN